MNVKTNFILTLTIGILLSSAINNQVFSQENLVFVINDIHYFLQEFIIRRF